MHITKKKRYDPSKIYERKTNKCECLLNYYKCLNNSFNGLWKLEIDKIQMQKLLLITSTKKLIAGKECDSCENVVVFS